VIAALLAVALGGPFLEAADVDQPSDQSLVYFNARMALREGEPLEAVKLWLLRNTLENDREAVSPYDEDFGSVTWAALGEMGICPDGHPTDEQGAGLWPLAMYNWIVANRNRRGASQRPKPFDAFDLGVQMRFVSIGDVLGDHELNTVSLFKGQCLRQRLVLIEAGELPTAQLSDRMIASRVLQYLLHESERTLADEGIRGRSVIQARLFDVKLQITALAAREARMATREQGLLGRGMGMSRQSVRAMADDAPDYVLNPSSEAARILEACLDWSIDEWMAVGPERRLFLFHHAREYGGDRAKLDRIALGVIDRLIAQRDGTELTKWVANRVDEGDLQAMELLWGGERGERLLGLDTTTGFQERAVVALHRGVAHLGRGELPDALRSLAYALQKAPESRASEEVASLALRWMSFIASQYVIEDDLLITLSTLVPRREYTLLLEDLMWRATFHADHASFKRGLASQQGRGALERRLDLLRPLAQGNAGRFNTLVRQRLRDNPGETLRFLGQFADRLELEDAGIRSAQLVTLRGLRDQLRPLIADPEAGRMGRTATKVSDRLQAIIDGVGALDLAPDARDRARGLRPGMEVFAGSVRLAPTDALPWPFRRVEVPAPSVFTGIRLVPVEWRRADGTLVHGWSLRG
jgi:hypothetical protein